MLLWFIYGLWAGLTASLKALFRRNLFTHSFVFPSIFLRFCWSIYGGYTHMVLLFKCCQCIITAPINNHCTCWRTNPLLTKHWLIRGTSVSVYIDHVTYFNRTTTVTNLIRVYNTIRIPCPETRLLRVLFKWYKH